MVNSLNFHGTSKIPVGRLFFFLELFINMVPLVNSLFDLQIIGQDNFNTSDRTVCYSDFPQDREPRKFA